MRSHPTDADKLSCLLKLLPALKDASDHFPLLTELALK